jgi:GNAT superfamily N-acetyltransferase
MLGIHLPPEAAMPVEFAPVRLPADVDAVASLAREIWDEFYVPLIGRAQVDYMVAKFQSAAAVGAQIASGYEYYLVLHGGEPVGYLSVLEKQDERALFVSKFYLLHRTRGTGTGRTCMEFIERLARQRGLGLLWLTVNKGNPSVNVYKRLGFQIAAELVMDIGSGFVMDDYRMEKQLG